MKVLDSKQSAPANKVLRLIAQDLEGDRMVAQAIFGEQLNGSDDRASGRLVIMKKVTPK